MSPTVSIGLPVYNGADHLATALDALLGQDFEDFELLISDNASTDATASICKAYCQKDLRIRYMRNASNVGAIENFNRVFAAAKSPYIMFAGHHDLWAPSLLTRYVSALQDSPKAVLAFCPARLIDDEGHVLRLYDDNLDTTGLDLIGRVHVVLCRLQWRTGAATSFYGLMRRDAFAQTRGYQNIFGPDWVALLELALLGPFVKVPEPLFSLRVRQRTISEQYASLEPGNTAPKHPLVDLTWNILRTVCQRRVPLILRPILLADALYLMWRKFDLLGDWLGRTMADQSR